MDMNVSLLRFARAVLSRGDEGRTAEAILSCLVEITGAERGCFVALTAGGLRELARIDRSADASSLGIAAERQLLQRAIDERSVVGSTGLDEPRSDAASGAWIAMAVPFCDALATTAVVYLEIDQSTGFSRESKVFAREASGLASPAIRDAVDRELRLRAPDPAPDPAQRTNFDGIVTAHPEMLAVLDLVERVAPSRASVLILGPTGTGKELLAQAVHRKSERRGGPFVTVHCSAIPASLLEAELFGHVAGAFTGAHRDRQGRIAGAHGGTLFLDEIGEIPLDFQAKLLRFLQFGEIQRVGSDRVESVDVRVVSATHQNLRELTQQRKFREDLYYRINAVTVLVPPLRERRSDIPLLVQHVLAQHRGSGGPRLFSARATEILHAYDYPGNVRELIHVVERACLLTKGAVMDVDSLAPEVLGAPAIDAQLGELALTSASLEVARAEAVAAAERAFLRKLMRRAQGNVSRAARDAGMHRSYLQKLLARHRASLDTSEIS